MNPAIAVPAYARPTSLERLLTSLVAADVPPDTTLLITVDCAGDERHHAGNRATLEVARQFNWPHGPKEVIAQPNPLGLVGNVHFCGQAAVKFGAVIVLEDDLVVSRRFHAYARQALEAYGAEPRLAGISLNSPWFNGLTLQPFIPLPDDGDVFFLQLSTPHGQAYTAEQWAAYSDWLASSPPQSGVDAIHPLLAALPSDDWLGAKARYLAHTDRYYVYPRESLTTNFGETGTHFDRPTDFFQVPLQHRRGAFRFLPLDSAAAVYDGYYELRPDRLNRLTDRLHGLSYEVDLYASKPFPALRAEYVLTTRPCRRAQMTFGRALRPLEANVIAGTPGRGITLARREDVMTGAMADLAAQSTNDRYFAHNRRTGWRYRLRAMIARRLYHRQLS